MSDPDTLIATVQQTFGRVLALLTSEPIPSGFDQQVRLYGELRSKLGLQSIGDSLSLQRDELEQVSKIVADVDRRLKPSKSTDEHASKNLTIAQLRLLCWFETIAQRKPTVGLSIQFDSIVSEDLSRKRIRALELVVRSLVGERHAEPQALVEHLRELLGDQTVDRWLSAADQNDILSGTAFSELASIFVNRQEFVHHERLFDDGPFLTLLREKRKTIQMFLDDIRRLRNAFAHNKRVSDIQLTLFDLYYDELITPVELSHQQGETKVDPAKYLDVSDADLDDYFSGLHDDVMSVKGDIAELRDALEHRLGVVEKHTAEIRESTAGLNKKVLWTTVGVAVAVVAGAVAIYQNLRTQDRVAVVGETTDQIKKETGDLADSAKQIQTTTQHIKDTTKEITATGTRIEKNTDEIRDDVGKVVENTKRTAQTLEEIRDGFQALTTLGGIIPDAKTPQEVYHNARVYETEGNYLKARQSYARFFAFNLDLVDPHLRFQAFLKLQEGREGAREMYNALKLRSTSFVTTFASLLLLDRKARVRKLEKFTAQHADFAPAYYALSRDYSEARLGDQASADKAAELKYLRTFLDLHDKGHFLKYMLDQELANTQLVDARQRLEALKTVREETLKNPITLTGIKSNQGWMIQLHMVGKAKQISYRTDEEQEFTSTGFLRAIDPETGFKLPKTWIELDPDIGVTMLFIKYTDLRNQQQGPFSLKFDPVAELFRSAKEILGRFRKSWVAFRDYDGKTLFYFTHLMTHRHALDEIRYGIDVDVPNKLYDFPPPDPKNPIAVGVTLPFIEVPSDTKFATIQLKYKDGTLSKVQRYKRRK